MMQIESGEDSVLKQKGCRVEEPEDPSSITCSRVTSAPVRNQGRCGDCWAYSTAQQIRYMHYHKYREDVGTMSVQYLVDCDPDEAGKTCSEHGVDGVKGCCGGLPILADQWLEASGGLPTRDQYGPTLSDKNPATAFTCKSDVPKAVKPIGYHWWHSETKIA